MISISVEKWFGMCCISSVMFYSSIRKINCDSGLKGCVIYISVSISE